MEKTGYLTVSSLTKYIKYKFDSDKNLRQIHIKGEISNFKKHSSGHMYFSLKDETSKINAIMFSKSASKLNFVPAEGTKVLALGRITIFESTGAYQIYIDEMILDGVGNLYIAFEKLKQDLYKEGLFDPSKKKKIPTYPKRVGVITAKTGAAIRDILSTIKRRNSKTEVIILEALVQGEAAAKDIANKIKLAENYNLDVLIIGRGGGSIEDLWPFNEEIVARAISDCTIPVISGTGHETDTTIADYVADLRAPTPTAAAELAVPNKVDLINNINQLEIRINKTMSKKIEHNKLRINNIKNSFIIKNPNILIDKKIQLLDLTNEKINNIIKFKINDKQNTLMVISKKVESKNPLNICITKQNNLKLFNNKIETLMNKKIIIEQNKISNLKNKINYLRPNISKHLEKLNNLEIILNKDMENYLKNKNHDFKNILDKLELVNPIGILSRGYSVVYKKDKAINSVENIKKNDELTIKLHSGKLTVNVKELGE